jgi:hypothetical protein
LLALYFSKTCKKNVTLEIHSETLKVEYSYFYSLIIIKAREENSLGNMIKFDNATTPKVVVSESTPHPQHSVDVISQWMFYQFERIMLDQPWAQITLHYSKLFPHHIGWGAQRILIPHSPTLFLQRYLHTLNFSLKSVFTCNLIFQYTYQPFLFF